MRHLPLILLTASICLADQKLGKPLTLGKPQMVSDLVSKPDASVGKTVQVKGKVTEVCQMAGCWMALADYGKLLRIKVNDGDIVFPKEAVGKMAVAEGKLEKSVLTREQTIARAKHEADEQGRKFDPASIKSGSVVYQIAGTGAVLLD